jgi:YD repeat-containing protein
LQLHARRDYRHNNANQRTEVTEDNGRKWSFDYDSLGQVVKAEKLESSGEEVLPGFAFAYTFDDIGNRTQTIVNERTAAYIY